MGCSAASHRLPAARAPHGRIAAGHRVEPSITALISAAQAGDATARELLFTRLYSELRDLARRQLARSAPGATLSPTTVLHEAYLQLAAQEGAVFPDRARFMAYAARVMRGVIIDHVRARRAVKRGGTFDLTTLDEDAVEAAADHEELGRVSDALDDLATVEPALAVIVDLKFFCGFSFAEVAALQGVSERTVYRLWERARIYLHRALGPSPPAE
jgi:RNA polymerase sigma factor (TIGR02999 family)